MVVAGCCTCCAVLTLNLYVYFSEAACTTGYSPFLSFNVEGFDEMLPRLLQLGASLDGPIKHPSFGKV